MTDDKEPAQWAIDRARELIGAEYLALVASVVAAAGEGENRHDWRAP